MKPPDVVVAIFQDQNRILLQYRINTPRSPQHWGLPAGTVELGETSRMAIHREMMEELGVSFTPQCDPDYSYTSDDGKRFDAFVVNRYTGVITNREPTFCNEIAWFEINQLPKPLTTATAGVLRMHRGVA